MGFKPKVLIFKTVCHLVGWTGPSCRLCNDSQYRHPRQQVVLQVAILCLYTVHLKCVCRSSHLYFIPCVGLFELAYFTGTNFSRWNTFKCLFFIIFGCTSICLSDREYFQEWLICPSKSMFCRINEHILGADNTELSTKTCSYCDIFNSLLQNLWPLNPLETFIKLHVGNHCNLIYNSVATLLRGC